MKAVLDACVLYPTVLREILIGAADAGLYQPVWSARILDEWRHAAARLGPDQAVVAGAEIALLRLPHPQAEAPDSGAAAAGFDWPDPADRHVAETALASGAELIVTANLRDFPMRALSALGLRAVHPDAFLLDLWRRDPGPVAASVRAAHAKAQALGGRVPLRDLMARARLPRLARALARAG
ncbi:RSP_2648 family PIN domain-containing protein [Paracoccus sp. (in: a-proteobacteria)]|uniref:RSP_2648 family PIN domain-containing protein n=1 Tax=Paracoccus sp. TaxID=267 RepID=UPI0026E11031|nr:PIN domain-containing protein [Paracoccus sp. (in: a-proteobacteria)]MDO5369987.1 PIN domain-containing protein [Paracoccus sp. (in: a-proteobacteria)]